MNRIYKVIWSKVKHQYVVVSELAHRDGKRSHSVNKSVKTMLAVLAVCGMTALSGLGIETIYADGAETTPGQYIAVAVGANNKYKWPGWPYNTYEEGDTRTFTDAQGHEHNYTWVKVGDNNYWVRKGYTIDIVEQPRYGGAGQEKPDKNIIIYTHKGENADSDGLVQSYQNVQENMNINTLNGDRLFSTDTAIYGGAVNTSVTEVSENEEYIINEGATAIGGSSHTNLDIKGGPNSYFQPVNYDSKTGLYHFGSIDLTDNIVSTENLYVVNGTVGVFTKTLGGETMNDIYTGDVYGRNNEILMTGVNDKGKYVSYWGTEVVDPNATIGSMTISTLQGKFDEVDSNIEKIHKDDIKEIQVTPKDNTDSSKGGTIGLLTNGNFDAYGNPIGGANIPGSITVSSIGGTEGNDVAIQFANSDGSFTVDAGSKVVGMTGGSGTTEATEGDTLTAISINGQNYKLGGGNTTVKLADGENNLAIDEEPNGQGGKEYTVSLNKELNVTSVNAEGTAINSAGLTAGKVKVNAENETVTGLSNTEWTTSIASLVENNAHGEAGYAATQGQLKDVDDKVGSLHYSEVGDGDLTIKDSDSVTEAIGKIDTKVDEGWTAQVGNSEINVNPTNDALNFTGDSNITVSADTAHRAIQVKLNPVVTLDEDKYDYNEIELNGDDGTIKATNKLGNLLGTTNEFDFDNNGGTFTTTTTLLGTNKHTAKFNAYGATFTRTGIFDTSFTNIDGDTITTGNITAGTIKVNAGNNGMITGLKNTTLNVPGFGESKRAATEEQLKEAMGKIDESSYKAWNVSANGESGTAVKSGKTVDFSGAKDTKSNANIIVTKEHGDDGNTSLAFDLADNITLGNENGQHIQLNGNPGEDNNMISIADENGDTVFSVAQNGTLSSGGDVIAYANDNNRAYSLSEVGQFAVRYDSNNGAPNKNKITLGGATGTTITNVAKGVNDSDAVNVAQLKDVEMLAGQHTSVSVGDNLGVTSSVNSNGGTDYKVTLDDTIYLGGSHTAEDNKILLDGETGKIGVGSSIALDGSSGTAVIGGVTVNTAYNQDTGKPSSTITGLANTTWDNDLAAKVANSAELQGTAATQGQLKNAVAAATTTLSNGKNTTVELTTDEKDGHTDYKVNLNDDLLLGAQDGSGNSIAVKGTEGSIILNSVSSDGNSHAIEINAASGTITGLTNTIGSTEDDWNTFMRSTDESIGSRAVTEDDLQLVAQHSVQYKTNNDGTVDYNNIFLNGKTYSSDDHTGGTMIMNVAYASDDDGSAAVNVDKLHDAISDAKTEVTNADQHLNYDKNYTVDRETNKVNLEVVDNQGNVVGNTTIEDVASATDVGNIGDLNEGIAHDSTGDGNVSIVDAVNNVDNKVGDLQYKHDDGSDLNYVTAGDSVTSAIGDLDAAIKDAAESASASRTEVASGDANIIVEDTNNDKDGKHSYNVSLNKDLSVDTVTASGNVSAGSFTTGDITINGTKEDGTHTGTINGLSNTTWNANAIVSGQAATEDQLKAATEAGVQYDRNEDGTVNKGSITLGGPTYNEETHEGGTTITNVADGKNASDAVNMGQLWQTNQAVINNSNNIQMLSNSVNKLDTRIDRVGAGAAALAALHPLDFDPDAKWDFAAGYGNYRGANAVAVGAYYRPNEDLMFSVGGSMGGGENMVNAGVSLKIGAGSSNVTTSRVAMAKEIKAMRDVVAKQDAQIQKLTAMVNALVGAQAVEPDTTTMFPDVPENHWAYEAVKTMVKSGLVKGYPDGEFKGDRTMTRYEFAQIVHNAIQAGVEVDARLVQEFKPELEYFHIATVAQDKDGNPTIQRVRAN